jgi:flagellar basal body-associated protein FliL
MTMSETKETTNTVAAGKKNRGASMLMLILLVVLVWAVIAFYMAMNSTHQEPSTTVETHATAEQQQAVQESVPAPAATEQAAPAPAGESAAQPAGQGDPMEQIIQVFAPEQQQ